MLWQHHKAGENPLVKTSTQKPLLPRPEPVCRIQLQVSTKIGIISLASKRAERVWTGFGGETELTRPLSDGDSGVGIVYVLTFGSGSFCFIHI